MGMYVDAEPPARFRAWLRQQAAPAAESTSAQAQRGRDTFVSNACASCHTIRGTQARGTVGPDLTHLQSRRTLAALTIPNDRPHLSEWIRDPQHVKPGNRMPALQLSDAQYADMVAYLETLR
jgi:cytochrome c oxidase subunit 2